MKENPDLPLRKILQSSIRPNKLQGRKLVVEQNLKQRNLGNQVEALLQKGNT